MKNKSDQEIEVKFYIADLDQIRKKLIQLNASLIQERCFESNLRFDMPNSTLQKQRHVLRLRKDTQNILTFKGAAEEGKMVSVRQEIEVVVDDFDTMRHILELLGYLVVMEYEKYRTTYRYENTLVVLDELPYGTFIEIEGPEGNSIQEVAQKLDLRWETRVTTSYVYLFDILKKTHPEFNGKNLTFSVFIGYKIMPDELKVHPADFPKF
jgi:adenylate cyclase class 2